MSWYQTPEQVSRVYSRLRSGWVGAACLGEQHEEAVVFPGSFNPLHDGHRRMAAVAGQRLDRPVVFEISLLNVEKPELSEEAVWDRCRQFVAGDTLWLTRARTFEEKVRLFPKSWFVIGVDTLSRLVDPGYYDGSIERRDRALERIMHRRSRFLVFGRVSEGRFVTLDDLDLPEYFAVCCSGVSEAEFRVDVSSRQLRAQSGGNP